MQTDILGIDVKVKSESEVAQLCPTLCNPMDYSLPRSSIHGIFQVRVLEWVAIDVGVDIKSVGWSWKEHKFEFKQICWCKHTY